MKNTFPVSLKKVVDMLPSPIPDIKIASFPVGTYGRVYRSPADGWLWLSGYSMEEVAVLTHGFVETIGTPPTWSDKASYTKGDSLVSYNGYLYQAINNSTGVVPSDTNYWTNLPDFVPSLVWPIASDPAGSAENSSTFIPIKSNVICVLGYFDNNEGTQIVRYINDSHYGRRIRMRFISVDGVKRQFIDTGNELADNVCWYQIYRGTIGGLDM